jgi:hypothetical protein
MNTLNHHHPLTGEENKRLERPQAKPSQSLNASSQSPPIMIITCLHFKTFLFSILLIWAFGIFYLIASL